MEANPHEQLADIFNDPTFPVRNIACVYDVDGKKTMQMAPPYPLSPDGVLIEFDGIFNRVKDLDPSEFSIRNGPWIEEKSQVGLVYQMLQEAHNARKESFRNVF